MTALSPVAEAIAAGRAVLGIELGSTRIKACLVADDPSAVVAAGSHEWENRFADRMWTYSLEDVETGLQAAFAALRADVRERHGVELTALRVVAQGGGSGGGAGLDQ